MLLYHCGWLGEIKEVKFEHGDFLRKAQGIMSELNDLMPIIAVPTRDVSKSSYLSLAW